MRNEYMRDVTSPSSDLNRSSYKKILFKGKSFAFASIGFHLTSIESLDEGVAPSLYRKRSTAHMTPSRQIKIRKLPRADKRQLASKYKKIPLLTDDDARERANKFCVMP